MRPRIIDGCVISLMGVSTSGLVHAETALPSRQAEPYRLIFTSSAACQNPAEFTNQLGIRTTRLRPALGTEPAVTVLVDLVRTPELIRGQLVIRAADGSLTVREVPGVDCHEVLSAMALIVALEVDDRPPVLAVAPTTPAASGVRSAWNFAVGLRVTATSGAVPGLAPGLAVYGEVALPGNGLFSPRFRLSGLRTENSELASESEASVVGEAATAEFELLLARLSGCPLHWAPSDFVGVRPCAFLELGELRAQGNNVRQAEPERTFLWSAGGLEVALEVLPAGPLTLGAEAGLVFPLIREAFYFDPEGPEERVHEVSAVGFVAAIGAGLRFF